MTSAPLPKNLKCSRTNQILAGCIPIENTLQNGSMQRNDSEDGGMLYKFQCNKGFRLNGSAVIQCHEGHWNGSKPSCERKGEYLSPEYSVVERSFQILLISLSRCGSYFTIFDNSPSVSLVHKRSKRVYCIVVKCNNVVNCNSCRKL